MTENKLLLILAFALVAAAALILGYVFLWADWSSPTPPKNTNPTVSVGQAEKELREARTQRDDLAFAAEQVRSKANKAKEDADALQKRAIKNNVDFNDPTSQTAIARGQQQRAEQDAARAERLAEEAKDKYSQAERNLAAARNPPASPEAPATQPTTAANPRQDPDSLFGGTATWLPTALAVLSLISVLTLFWWTWKLQKKINATTEELVNILLTKQSEKYSTLNSAVAALKDVPDKLARLQSDVAKVSSALYTEQQARLAERHPGGDGAQHQTAPGGWSAPEPEPPAPDVLDFPIAAESFLARVGGPQQIVKHDHLKGMLVRDPEERGQLVLVRDQSVPGGQLCIIPRVTRFRAAQDFHNHYEKFYDCTRPGAGEVWVVDPAVVGSVDGGWELLERGLLEIKS
jgi:hypothetical protein